MSPSGGGSNVQNGWAGGVNLDMPDAASSASRDAAAGGIDDATKDAPAPPSDALADAGIFEVIDCHTHFFDPTRPTPTGRDRPVPWPDPITRCPTSGRRKR
jgi:hypothetical protein